MNDPVMNIIEWMQNEQNLVNFGKYILILFAFCWILVVWWIWTDSYTRIKNLVLQTLLVLVVLLLPGVGLIIYLIIRPKKSIEDNTFINLESALLQADYNDLFVCKKCKETYRDSEYCIKCGEELKIECPRCKNRISKSHKFCKYCGYKFENLSSQKPQKENKIKYESFTLFYNKLIKEVPIKLKNIYTKKPIIVKSKSTKNKLKK